MGGYNCDWPRWAGFWGYRNPVGKFDTIYKNADGMKHRLFGPAYISETYDVEIWFKEGVIHREGGPAIRHKNNKLWYVNGVLHNLDGPAVVDMGAARQFWIDGIKYSPKQYKWELARRKRKGLIP